MAPWPWWFPFGNSLLVAPVSWLLVGLSVLAPSCQVLSCLSSVSAQRCLFASSLSCALPVLPRHWVVEVLGFMGPRVRFGLSLRCASPSGVGGMVRHCPGASFVGIPVTRSLGHSVTRSFGHSVTWSLGHSVTWSLGHSIIQSLVISVTPTSAGHSGMTSRNMSDGSDQK